MSCLQAGNSPSVHCVQHRTGLSTKSPCFSRIRLTWMCLLLISLQKHLLPLLCFLKIRPWMNSAKCSCSRTINLSENQQKVGHGSVYKEAPFHAILFSSDPLLLRMENMSLQLLQFVAQRRLSISTYNSTSTSTNTAIARALALLVARSLAVHNLQYTPINMYITS